ncbi:MAG TPA: glycosyl hydrolase family 8, partial [Candidatus Goldiibacteriota bacterium]|nr:glycosyl hydrolase family 8 [Candidatus Goldiibacteriota bacterium]
MKDKTLKLVFIVTLLAILPAFAGAATLFHTTYPYGSQAPDDSTLVTKYNTWYGWFATTSGANGYRRVQYPEGLTCAGGGATASEGIGYGMLLAIWFGDQTFFNEMWNYKNTVSPRTGLMAWCVNSQGVVFDPNSATDADVDIAMALILAHRRWGSAGAYNYSSLATTEVNKVAANDVCGSDYRLYPGNYCSCTSNDNTYPSYFTPAWYREFGIQTGNTTFWNNVVTKTWTMLGLCKNATTGLAGEQCRYDGASLGQNDGYNSARIPWRYAQDYVWNGDANALAQITLTANWFTGKATSAAAVYQTNGTVVDATHNGMRVGSVLPAMMVPGKSTERGLWYTEASSVFNDSGHFYNASLALLGLILTSGNCPRMFGTPQPTATPQQGDLFDDCEDGDNQNLWGGFWYTYYDRFVPNQGQSYVVPWPVSQFTSVGRVPTPFYMQAPGLGATGVSALYAARMTGYTATNFTYGFIGMGSGTNQNSG